MEITTPLRKITGHMRSRVTSYHPVEVIFPPLPQRKLVLDLATPEGCKAELTWVVVVVISQDINGEEGAGGER